MLKLQFFKNKLNAGPIIMPACLPTKIWDKVPVRSSFVVLRLIMLNTAEVDPAATPTTSRLTITMEALFEHAYEKFPAITY